MTTNVGRRQAQEHIPCPEGDVEAGWKTAGEGRGGAEPREPCADLLLPSASCAAPSRQEKLHIFPPKKLSKLARRSRRPKRAWDLEEGPVQASPSLLTGPVPTHSLPLSTPRAPIHRAAAHRRAPGEEIPAASPLTNTSRPPESLNRKLHSFTQQIVPDGQDGVLSSDLGPGKRPRKRQLQTVASQHRILLGAVYPCHDIIW